MVVTMVIAKLNGVMLYPARFFEDTKKTRVFYLAADLEGNDLSQVAVVLHRLQFQRRSLHSDYEYVRHTGVFYKACPHFYEGFLGITQRILFQKSKTSLFQTQ